MLFWIIDLYEIFVNIKMSKSLYYIDKFIENY